MSAGLGPRCGITGRGHALPATVRSNDDPVFQWLRDHDPDDNNFFGYDQRRVLAPGERLVDLMQVAALQALAQAGLAAAEVELLTGFGSVSEFVMPNDLAQLHQKLGLAERCWVVPINNEYSTLNAGLLLADALMRSGPIANALVVCGANWSRHVDYHTPAAASAADGAGAVVLQRTDDAATFRVADFEVLTRTLNPGTPAQPTYANMMMSADRAADAGGPAGLSDRALYTQPYFHITDIGMQEFGGFGVHEPPAVVNRLLQRNGLQGSQVTLICHQTSAKLLQAWADAIRPHELIHTLSTWANMTTATMAVNLSACYAQIATDHLVLLGIGPELHTHALLMRRNG